MNQIGRSKQAVATFVAVAMLIVIGLAAAADNQDGPTVSAKVNKEVFGVGEVATLSVTVEGVTDCDVPVIPDVAGLQIRYVGPSTQVQWTNGEVVQSVSFRYAVEASEAGTYEIPAIEIDACGETARTEPLKIEVTESSADQRQQSGLDGSLFLLLESEKSSVYSGEKVQLKVTLCIDGVRVTEVTYPQLLGSGFLVGEFADPLQGTRTLDGRTLQTLEFRTYITPAIARELVVGPATMECEIRVAAQSRDPFAQFFSRGFPDFDSFFDSPFLGSTTTTTVTVESEPLTLTVKPFPDSGKPQSFTGAVGDFTVITSATPTTVRVGDPINLRIEVSGEGNMRSVSAPRIFDSDQFKTYDPIVQSTSESSRVFEQVVVVKNPTVSEIPPVSLVYFNPETEQYETASSAAIPITVTPGPLVQASSQLGKQHGAVQGRLHDQSESAQTGLLYIKGSPGRLALLKDPIRSSGFLAPSAAIITFLLAASVATSAYRGASKNKKHHQQRQRVYQTACSVLERLESEIPLRDTSEIVDEARGTLASLVRAQGSGETHRGITADEVLRRLDILCYSPTPPSEQETREAVALCKQVVGRMSNSNRKTDRRPAPPVNALLLMLALVMTINVQALASSGSKDSALEFFHKGNALYESGDYTRAAGMYSQAIEHGYVSGNLYFNMGNALAKTGSYAEALLHYIRAAEFIPRDRELQHNTEVVMSALGLVAPTSDKLVQSSRLHQVIRHLTQSEWAIVTLCAYAAFSLLVAWKLLLRDRADPPLSAIALVGCILVMTTCGTLYRRNLYLNDQRVVVTAQEATVRFEPDTSAAIRYIAPAGSILYKAGEPDSDFLVVRDEDGQLGWVNASSIRSVGPEIK